MAIVGVGTDLCRVSRIVRTLDRFGDRFLERAFHPTEAAFLRRLRDERSPHLGSALASRCVPPAAWVRSRVIPRAGQLLQDSTEGAL